MFQKQNVAKLGVNKLDLNAIWNKHFAQGCYTKLTDGSKTTVLGY